MATVTVTFDTLQAAQDLIDAGFSEKQAKAAVRVISDAQARLVTKEDLNIAIQGLLIKQSVVVATMLGLTVAVLGFLIRLPH